MSTFLVKMMTLDLLILILMCAPTHSGSLVHKEIHATDGETIQLECDAMDGFQIHFSQNNADTLTIGGCSSFRICYLMNATLKENYSLAATSDGGHLTMRNIGNEHYGTYTCTDAFDYTNPRSILVLRRHNMVINGYGADETIVPVWKLFTIILIVNI